MTEPNWLTRLLVRVVELKQELRVRQTKAAQLEAENKRLRYRLKRLWTFDDVRTEIPDWRSMWWNLKIGSVLVDPGGTDRTVITISWPTREVVELDGPNSGLGVHLRDVDELRKSGWFIKAP